MTSYVNKLKPKKHFPIYLVLILVIILLILGFWGFIALSKWYDNHKIQTHQIIKVELKWPITIEKRQPIIQQASQSAIPKKETANEKVIRLVNEKFGTDAPATLILLQGESGIRDTSGEWTYRYWAVNQTSGACGLFQALPCEKMPCGLTWQDIECQIDWGKKYITGRYSTSTDAYSHWLAQAPHWY